MSLAFVVFFISNFAWSHLTCESIFTSGEVSSGDIMFEAQEPTNISFKSARTGKTVNLSMTYVQSIASRSYTDGKLKVDIYNTAFSDTSYSEDVENFRDFSLPFLILVRHRFLQDFGYTVPKVIDYSQSVFQTFPDDSAYILKTSVSGIPAGELIDLDDVTNDENGNLKFVLRVKDLSGIDQAKANELEDAIKEVSDTVRLNLVNWVREQPDLNDYYHFLIRNPNRAYFNFFFKNWVLDEEGHWLLSDL